MTKLVLEISNQSDLDILLPLLLQLKIRFSSLENTTTSPEEVEAAIDVVSKGCDMDSFGDALSYQIESRQDRALPFR
ncbi:hypothetical protein [Haliscomenobacter hydrossis]|uniref:Uncharacterized protein n=1 Tax=Haliscomenobacter hydrossis (strain ATCC 27775 / DSM 1100 / LMG 10767 / O) TaxID=760192 RepID=F4KPF7_HALH1|nr:hypothetical protein [Haliscomenobacter hydrossis]AEE49911.1 hypothetical protein Halhy_2026 [Haliscomenobacter hydrossis DSM 1100]